MFAIYGHCASGYRELWDTAETLEAAKQTGAKVLDDHPVTPCGTGGVKWVEIIGGENEPTFPSHDDPQYETKLDAWHNWEPNVMIGLSRDDNGHWQSA